MEIPWEMNLIRAARYMGCPPWELATQSVYWMNLALATEEAETRARNIIRRNAQRKANRE
jgi:hypothetical protein